MVLKIQTFALNFSVLSFFLFCCRPLFRIQLDLTIFEIFYGYLEWLRHFNKNDRITLISDLRRRNWVLGLLIIYVKRLWNYENLYREIWLFFYDVSLYILYVKTRKFFSGWNTRFCIPFKISNKSRTK